MSYAKVKTITINERENKIIITSAENNIRPLYYSKWELGRNDSTFKEKMYSLFENLIYRDLQLQNSCSKKIINATNKLLNKIQEIKNNSEYDYYTQFANELKNELFEMWLAALNEPVSNDKYIIKLWNCYLKKLNTRTYTYTYNQEQAKVYSALEIDYILQRCRAGISEDAIAIKL